MIKLSVAFQQRSKFSMLQLGNAKGFDKPLSKGYGCLSYSFLGSQMVGGQVYYWGTDEFSSI